jgi:hydrogenase-4 component B
VRAFGIPFLGRPRGAAAEAAREVDRFSLAAMGTLALLCLLAGVFPGLMIDALKPVVQLAVGAAMPLQSKLAWLSIAPIAAARSSYNGLLVFLFIAISASLAATVIHRFASAALRRAPAWDCGFPEPSSAMQYTAESFSQPIRRVFGGFAFRARETVDMPTPGQTRSAVFRVALRDPIWEAIYAPIERTVAALSTRLDPLQFLTIRQYLSVVFGSLVFLLLLLAGWP